MLNSCRRWKDKVDSISTKLQSSKVLDSFYICAFLKGRLSTYLRNSPLSPLQVELHRVALDCFKEENVPYKVLWHVCLGGVLPARPAHVACFTLVDDSNWRVKWPLEAFLCWRKDLCYVSQRPSTTHWSGSIKTRPLALWLDVSTITESRTWCTRVSLNIQ